MHERPIVVGVDGTATALRAVTWAADEAHVRCRPLHIVHAAPYLPADDVEDPVTRRRVDALLARARATAQHAQPDLDVVIRTLPEPPISALVDASRDADLLVLGMLDDADAEIVLGPAALNVVTDAQCPVTVVHGHGHGHGSDGSGRPAPVLVGIESVEADAAAITLAFADAARRHAGVVVVHVPHLSDRPAVTAAALRDELAPWRSQHPEVGLDIRIDHGNPGIALLHESNVARHIVIGTRRRGVAARAVLGSVSRFVLRHSRVPVTVVPRRLSTHHVARTPSDQAQDPHDRSQLW